MATVTNKAVSARGFATLAGGHVMLAPGQTAEIDLAPDHAVHDAWVAAGHVEITLSDEETELDSSAEETSHVGKRKRAVHKR